VNGLWLAAHGLAALWWLVLMAAAGAGASRSDRVGAMACALVALGLAVAACTVPIDPELVTVLHEGPESANIHQLTGLASHTGGSFEAVVLALGESPRLVAVLRLNLALGAVATMMLVVLGRVVLGGWPGALLFAAANAISALSIHLVLSELPSAMIGVYVVGGALALALHSGRTVWAAAAAGWVVLATAVVAGARPELAAIGVPVSVGAWLAVWKGDQEVGRLAHAALWPPRPWSGTRRALVGVVVVVSLLSPLVLPNLFRDQLGWAVQGLAVLHPSALTLPFSLAGVVNTALVILFVAGVVGAGRRSAAGVGLVVGTLILHRTYYAASHTSGFEMVRYMTYALPAVLVIALFGWRQLGDLAERLGSSAWRLPMLAALLLAWATPPVNGTLRGTRSPTTTSMLGLPGGWLLATAQQEEVRLLLEAVERWPECVFVAPVTTGGLGSERVEDWEFVVFGRGVADRVVSDLPVADCVLTYVGTDCALRGAQAVCEGHRRGPPLMERVVDTEPYNDPEEYGRVDRAVLAVYGTPLTAR
jgi:hypothetical protein